MPPLQMLWTEMRRAQAAFEAVQAKADAMTPEEDENAYAPAAVYAEIGLKLPYPSRFDDIQAQGGSLLRLADVILSEDNPAAQEAEALRLLCLTVAELFAYPLPEGAVLGALDAAGKSVNELLEKDFNTLLPLLSEELTLDVLTAMAESAGLQVQDAYTDYNSFFADILGQQGWPYTPGDSTGSALLAIFNRMAQERRAARFCHAAGRPCGDSGREPGNRLERENPCRGNAGRFAGHALEGFGRLSSRRRGFRGRGDADAAGASGGQLGR